MSHPVVVLESADAPLKGKPVCHTKTIDDSREREMNRSTVGVILRERCSDDGVVGRMPEIGKVLVGVHDRCRKRERSRKSCCHRVIAVVIRLRKCPPATQTQSFLREQPSPSNATPETSWLERDGTAPWFLSLKTKPNIKRYQLRCCVLLP